MHADKCDTVAFFLQLVVFQNGFSEGCGIVPDGSTCWSKPMALILEVDGLIFGTGDGM